MNEIINRVGIIPIGEVPQIVSQTIAAHISGYLDLSAIILPGVKNFTDSFNENRLQYDVAKTLQKLESINVKGVDKILGILTVDLYVPIFTYVFGEAKQGGKAAVISLYRLGKGANEKTQPSSTVLERAAKVALHELGHLYSLFHCTNEHCLMHFSGGLQDLDGSPLYFCRYCSKYFSDALSSF
ncbi:MAG: archaemetzincin family Zn-dependent metalloprotease [Deltaproteobacteria bacterium]|nr:archaemetzincin family Zn-dependent metalloprotease [Deltaproteobacteria bacterium]